MPSSTTPGDDDARGFDGLGAVPLYPVDPTASLVSDTTGSARYQIVRSLDGGGQGDVFVAVDSMLNREVILKKLKDDLSEQEAARQRFLREIRIGALFEHPGMAPVYDLCRSPDGGWFGVYRYLPNGTLHKLVKDYHRDHPTKIDEVAFRSLLVHFATACRAIDFAHSREVLHLDVKPRNIVIGRFGETQVIDWGLAWLKGEDFRRQVAEGSGSRSGSGSETPVIDVSEPRGFRGTPAYASTEQHERRWDAIGPHSDVYGLGATLWEILAGAAPFDANCPSFREDVRSGHVHRRPMPWAPPELVAIAAKAMAPDPKARYDSAAALAADVDRHLADESVSAFPDPPSVRVWRFVKRHRAGVAAAAALLLTSAVALGIGYVAVAEQRDRAVKAEADAVVQRDRAREAEAMAVKERDRARDAEAEARRQERTARQNAAATRGVIAGFIESVADDRWAEVPGTAELRLEAVRKVLDEYPALIEQQPDDPDLRYDAALLDRRCANLYRTLGRLDDAKPLYERAGAEIRSLLETHPQDDRYRLGWILLLLDDGERALRTVGPDGALVIYREALADATKAVEVRPGSFFARRTLAQVRIDLADTLVEAGDAAEAAALSRRGVEGFDAIVSGGGDDDEETRVVTRMLAALASAVAARASAAAGEAGTALAMARDADRRSAELSGVHGGQPSVDYVRAVALRELGRVLSGEPRTRAEGAAASEGALGLLRGLVAGDGDVANFRPALADLLCDRADSLLDAGDASGAAARADEAIGVIEPLLAPGEAFEAKRHLARARALRGRAAKSRDDLLLARACYDAVLPAAPRNEKLRGEAALVERLLAE